MFGLRLYLWLLLSGAFLRAAPAIAAPEALPVITEHSDTDVSVYKGDLLTLEVRASGDGIESKWIKGRGVFCRALSCEIDTGNWALGRHSVSFVVFNRRGSLFLRFNVWILQAPTDHRPTAVKPQLVATQEGLETVSAYDFSVKAPSGHGFAYHQRKLQVVGPTPRSLDWSERLRTQKQGTLEFGRVGVEDHILTGRSAAKLLKSSEDRRLILLKRGILRSRNLSAEAPRWSVVVGDWLQIDTDAQGDVLVVLNQDEEDDVDDVLSDDEEDVEKNEKAHTGERQSVTVTVLRGHARVYVRDTGKDKGPDAGAAVMVEQGLSLSVANTDIEVAKPVLGMAKKVRPLVKTTSPQYLPEQLANGLVDGGVFLGAKHASNFAAAITAAQAANEDRDYFRTLEILAPYWGDIKQSYDATMLVGLAYSELFLTDVGAQYLRAAAALAPEAGAPYYELGRQALLARKWHDALKNFREAESRDFASPQLLDYDSGVAAFNAKHYTAAKGYFTHALWDDEVAPQITASARDFLQNFEAESLYELRLRGGLFYDSNILRSNSLNPASLGEGLNSNRSSGYTGAIGFSLWPIRGEGGGFEFAYDAGKDGYFNPTLSKLDLIQEKFALNVYLGFGGVGDQQVMKFEASFFLWSEAIGGQRSLDQVGTVVAIGSPALYGLRLAYEITNAVDPLPGRDIIVDPIRWEVAPSADRSAVIKYYDLSAIPIASDAWRWQLGLRDGNVAYRSVYVQEEDFTDLGLRTQLTYLGNLRSQLSAGLKLNERNFPDSTDGRKDKAYTLGTGWLWYFTSYLYHDLDLSYEKQASTRSVNTYSREFVEYTLNLRL